MRRHAREAGAKINVDPDLVMAAMFGAILLLGCLAAVTLYQQGRIVGQQGGLRAAQRQARRDQLRLNSQQVMLDRLERRDRLSSYQTAYRFCSRLDIDRAVIHFYLTRAFGRKTRRQLEARSGLPILDCRPNFVGGPARYQSPSAQRRFVRRWRTGQLTTAELGICRVKIGTALNPRECAR